MIIKNAFVFRNAEKRFDKMDIFVKDGVIADLDKALSDCDTEIFDGEGLWVVPGLIDVHTHGRMRYDFVSCPPRALGDMAADYARHGVTTVMPTLASASFEEMIGATENINSFTPRHNEADFCGVHWEGRYLNPKKKGAHAEERLAPLDPEDMKAAEFSKCKALHISAAYELDGDGSFAGAVASIGATLGLGHTCATYEEAKTAESRGVTSYTHLFNAMPSLHHRDGGAVCAALLGDSFAELICDGIHVSPEMIALVCKAKGVERISLISDSMEATGCPDGDYSIAGNPVTVKNGKAILADGTLAGSTLTLDGAVRNLMSFCRMPLEEAIICATQTPACQMGIFDKCGSIDIGKKADMLFVSDKDTFKIEKIMLRGSFMPDGKDL